MYDLGLLYLDKSIFFIDVDIVFFLLFRLCTRTPGGVDPVPTQNQCYLLAFLTPGKLPSGQ